MLATPSFSGLHKCFWQISVNVVTFTEEPGRLQIPPPLVPDIHKTDRDLAASHGDGGPLPRCRTRRDCADRPPGPRTTNSHEEIRSMLLRKCLCAFAKIGRA